MKNDGELRRGMSEEIEESDVSATNVQTMLVRPIFREIAKFFRRELSEGVFVF